MVMDFFFVRIIPVLRCAFYGRLSPSKIDQTYVLSCFINYTNASSLRFSAPPQYHDIDANHNKCVVNGASIALLILRLRQNICQGLRNGITINDWR